MNTSTGLSKVTSELDGMIKSEREKVKRLGGLYVIGTSRHESRRIDNQLRGRAGRQGDPGGTRFFLSMEDDIFMTFGGAYICIYINLSSNHIYTCIYPGDKMGDVLEKFRVAEDMPIENDLVMQALDKVQEKVEAYFAANRRQVFKLDEVMSEQRVAIYKNRQKFLMSKDHEIIETFAEYCAQTMDEIYKVNGIVSIHTCGCILYTIGYTKTLYVYVLIVLIHTVIMQTSISESKKGVIELNTEKLCSKALQFFPTLKLSSSELNIDNAYDLAQSRLTDAIEEKRSIIDATGSAGAFVTFFKYLALVQTDESWYVYMYMCMYACVVYLANPYPDV